MAVPPQLYMQRRDECPSDTSLMATVTCTVPRTFPAWPPGGLVMRWANQSVSAQETRTADGTYSYSISQTLTVAPSTGDLTVTCAMTPVFGRGASRTQTLREFFLYLQR